MRPTPNWDYPVPCRQCRKDISLWHGPAPIFITKMGIYIIGPFCNTECADAYQCCENCEHCGWEESYVEGGEEIVWRVCRLRDEYDDEVDEADTCDQWEPNKHAI